MHSIKPNNLNTKKFRGKKYARFIKLWLEFNDYLKLYHGFYLDARCGYCLIQKIVHDKEKKLIESMNAEEKIIKEMYEHWDFKHEEFAQSYIAGAKNHRQRNGEVKKRTVRNGQNQEILTKILIVNLAAYWEVYLRKEVATAYGYNTPSDYKNDTWGYIVALRNSILHNKGRVDKTLVSRARKVGKNFKLNERIVFNENFAYDIFQKADGFLCKLHKESYSDSRAASRIIIPKALIDKSRSEGFRKKKHKNAPSDK
jgi:hypothetical protein